MCLVWRWIFKTLFGFDALDKQAFIFHCAARMKKTKQWRFMNAVCQSGPLSLTQGGAESTLGCSLEQKKQLTAGSSSWHQMCGVTWHRTSGTGKTSEQRRWPGLFVWILYNIEDSHKPANVFPLFRFNHRFYRLDHHWETKQIAHWHFLKYVPKAWSAPDALAAHNYFWVSRS